MGEAYNNSYESVQLKMDAIHSPANVMEICTLSPHPYQQFWCQLP